ncbi:MAG TPA: toprim domain-containing protein [Candidatus Paceibacterota bacterium]|nr:toprim domain-containing protein [Candidatus Paceibacterota bacterium]
MQVAKRTLKKPEGKEALNYLKNKRKLSDEIIERFDFGYCPSNIDHQLNGRIITPIYDVHKNLVALSTRSLEIAKKFWHESFDKSLYLYGLCYAKEEMMRCKKAILVEGEFDVAFLHSNGFEMAVGVCGSSFSLIQAGLLLRYCNEVFVVLDGDESGKKSTQRILDFYKKNNLNSYDVKYVPVYLPDNLDPDDYIMEKGTKSFKELLINSRKNNSFINN